jgi:RNA polymerase sigma factor (sigma-70 family)
LLATESSSDPVTALLSRAFAGDRAAENQLARRILMPAIDAAASRYLFGEGKRRFDKEDVVQEVLAHLYEQRWAKLRSFDPAKGTLISYVSSIVKHWLRDHSRRRPPPEPVDDPELLTDSGPGEKAQLGQVMDRMLASLDEEQILLFRWVHLQGLERAEIAERLQISIEAAYKRIQRMETHVRASMVNPDAPPPKQRDDKQRDERRQP